MKKAIITVIFSAIILGLIGCSDKGNSDVSKSGRDLINDDISVFDKEDDDSSSEDKRDYEDVANTENTEDIVDIGDIDNDNKVNENTENTENTESTNNTESTINTESIVNTESTKNIKNTGKIIVDGGGSDDSITVALADGSIGENTDNNDSDRTDNTSTVDMNSRESNNQKNTENDKPVETQVTDSNQDSSEKVQKLSEQGELSKRLALQMSKGEFEETHDMFTPLVKLQLTKDVLKKGWDDTVADIGNYKSIREVTEEKVNTNTVIYVILDYDTSGIRVFFSYDTNNKLAGLWISFAPYDSVVIDDSYEEIAISFGDSKNPIEGILTLPKNVKKPPVAILVHGSGNHDEDETIGVNKPFSDLAHGLACKGIAVIRYKEIIPKSSDKFTIQDDSLDSASQAIKYAQSCGKIDTDKIIVIGHSLGGMMAPKIAADNKEVDGIVSLAGSPRRLEDIVLDQVRILNRADKSITEAMYKLALAQANLQVKKVKELKDSSMEILLGYPASYWYSLNQIDISSIVKDLDIPIFIAQGSEDFQVYADIDYIEWQNLLRGKDKVIFRLYDGLNHLFMTANGRMNVTEYNIKGNVEQKVIDDIAKWILK